MYAEFASIYDALMDDVDYDKWTEEYLARIRRAGVDPKTLIDLGCGTGSIALRLAQKGLNVVGVDLSEPMLRVASEKARKLGASVRFIHQDMCSLDLPRPSDAILCACDGVNYLLDMHRVAMFFTKARASLRKGGVLSFDISSPEKLSRMAKERVYYEDREGITYLWTNQMSSGILSMELTFFIRGEDGRYTRFDEAQKQRAHSPSEMVNRMADAGFTDIVTEDRGDRIYFTGVNA